MPTPFGSHTVESEHADSKGVRKKLLEEMTVFKPGCGAGREGRERPRGSTASEEELGWWGLKPGACTQVKAAGQQREVQEITTGQGCGVLGFRARARSLCDSEETTQPL